MIIRRLSTIAMILGVAACEPQLVDDPIPLASFSDEVVNLLLPEYNNLRTDGGYKEISKIGVRGVIVYRVSNNVYRAYERNCSFQPNDACATVNVHSSRLYMTDPCCGSNFSFDEGNPTGGPAWRPLAQYRTQVNGTILTITDEIIN